MFRSEGGVKDGTGEWKNMQDIVRNSFQYCFEKIESQQSVIANLQQEVNALKSKVVNSPTLERQDVEDIINRHLINNKSVLPQANVTEFYKLISNIESQMQLKASIKYVDESLRNKVSKSDLMVSQLHSDHTGGLNALIRDINDLKSKYDSKVNSDRDSDPKHRISQQQTIAMIECLRRDVNEVSQNLDTRPTLVTVQQLLDSKANVSDIQVISRVVSDAALTQAVRFLASLQQSKRAIFISYDDCAIYQLICYHSKCQTSK